MIYGTQGIPSAYTPMVQVDLTGGIAFHLSPLTASLTA